MHKSFTFNLSLLSDKIAEQVRLLQNIYDYARNKQQQDTGFKHYSPMI